MTSHYTVTLTAVTEPVLVARISVLLRKYDIAIHSLQRQALTNNQETVTLQLQPMRDNFIVAMRKLERLVPIVELSYQEISA